MKLPRPGRLALGFATAALTLLLLASGGPRSLGAPPKNEDGGPTLTVQTKTVGSMYILARPNVGPYNFKRLAPVFDEVEEFARAHGVSGQMIGIYYDDSRRVPPDVQKSDIGILLSGPIELKPEDKPYYLKTFGPHEVAYARVRGRFREVPHVYQRINDWAWKNGYRIVHPVKEIYNHKPTQAEDDESLVTEVQFTIEKAPSAGR